MIEVRIDIHWMQNHQHNVLHSILMMQALRESGMPIIGKIVFNGPERGQLIQHRENTLDGDEWVVRWYDDGEPTDEPLKVANSGSGRGYTWVRYRNPGEKRRLLWHAESDSYVETEDPAEAERCCDEGCDDVTDMQQHEANFKAQKEWDEL